MKMKNLDPEHTFLISDTHFGHSKIFEFEESRRETFTDIEYMTDEIVRRWNEVVSPNDVVFHLGDIALGGVDIQSIVRRLNGKKYLIRGNHDNKIDTYYYNCGFSGVYSMIEIGSVILTHIPIHPQEFYRWTTNIHGHVHSKSIKGDDRYINVCGEVINYTPIKMSNLKEI